jgi:S-adenosylmethionine:tRNA ribosyltransferase-isomerase
MKTDRLDYDLPSELIAQHPAAVRSDSRLLVLDRATGELADTRFSRVGEFLRRGDCLVLNDTKVLPARVFLRRRTGGRLEGLFLRVTAAPDVWEIMLKGARKVRPGERIYLQSKEQQDVLAVDVLEKRQDGVCLVKVEAGRDPETVLEAVGFPPLPPYIRRDRDATIAEADRQRYQTVYARCPGAVAAPTAGLHFTQQLIQRLKEQGIRFACVTLHVGAGTFKPVATEHLEEHQIHREWFRVDEGSAAIINAARADSRRIIAVGTTAVRVLETVCHAGRVMPRADATSLFITPGYPFKIVDAMITNFHLPRSTLLALVAAFAGLEPIRRAYRHAIEQRYRFYSYGDAMLIS